MSGTENAIEGIWELNDAGMTCCPVAENDPTGTIDSKKGKFFTGTHTYQGRARRQVLTDHKD